MESHYEGCDSEGLAPLDSAPMDSTLYSLLLVKTGQHGHPCSFWGHNSCKNMDATEDYTHTESEALLPWTLLALIQVLRV